MTIQNVKKNLLLLIEKQKYAVITVVDKLKDKKILDEEDHDQRTVTL